MLTLNAATHKISDCSFNSVKSKQVFILLNYPNFLCKYFVPLKFSNM